VVVVRVENLGTGRNKRAMRMRGKKGKKGRERVATLTMGKGKKGEREARGTRARRGKPAKASPQKKTVKRAMPETKGNPMIPATMGKAPFLKRVRASPGRALINRPLQPFYWHKMGVSMVSEKPWPRVRRPR
jgi:hypothetical protein